MAIDIVTLAVSKKYTDNTIIGLGGLKGAPAIVKDIVHQNGVNIVTFEWTGIDGTKQTREMTVYDGTPIYIWESGNTYKSGDLAIYSFKFYICLTGNSDIIFDSTKWNEIGGGSVDGDYGIVENSSLLPRGFSASDRKMYYSIEDQCFWLWNGQKWKKQHPDTILVETIPESVEDNTIVLYVGETANGFVKGRLYQYKAFNNSWNDITNVSYSNIEDKPQINGNVLEGNKTSTELGIKVVGTYSEGNLYLHC